VLRPSNLALATAKAGAILNVVAMTLTVECAKEFEGRWFAEVPQVPGVRAYGNTRDAATEEALSMVYRVLENERRLGVQRSDTADVFGRESERRLSIVLPDRAAS
jgi:predicted RNase H-like HicB family nuclease